jgi:hypothetical protein
VQSTELQKSRALVWRRSISPFAMLSASSTNVRDALRFSRTTRDKTCHMRILERKDWFSTAFTYGHTAAFNPSVRKVFLLQVFSSNGRIRGDQIGEDTTAHSLYWCENICSLWHTSTRSLERALPSSPDEKRNWRASQTIAG